MRRYINYNKYLAEFCYGVNRRYNLDKMVARFGYVEVGTAPTTRHLLKLAELCG
jgi:hypothetical protein